MVPEGKKSANFMSKGVISKKRSAEQSYLIVLSWHSFLSLTNFFSLQKSIFFCLKIKCALFYELLLQIIL